MAATQLNQLLKILAVAGIFLSLVITAVFLVFAIVGTISGEEPTNAWIIAWRSFFIGLPLYGILYGTLVARESIRSVVCELQKKD